MKPMVYACILLVALLTFGFTVVGYLKTSSHQLQEYISELEASLAQGNWDEAEKKLSHISDQWEKTKKSWAMLIDHSEIDNIEITLKKMESHLRNRTIEDLYVEMAALKNYIDHIPEKEKLTIENVL